MADDILHEHWHEHPSELLFDICRAMGLFIYSSRKRGEAGRFLEPGAQFEVGMKLLYTLDSGPFF